MNNKEIIEHIQKCLELSSENKITPKNAFGLQLIDCMRFLIGKKDFSIMACTLDAGTKIYSKRVDALHHQVLKLAGEVILQRKNTQDKAILDDGNADKNVTKELRRVNKRNIIVSNGSLRKQQNRSNPRDKFITVAGLPGALLTACKVNAEDLSISIENNLKFWNDFDHSDPCKAEGVVTFPKYKINRNQIAEIPSFSLKNKWIKEEIIIKETMQPYTLMVENLKLEIEEQEEIDAKSETNEEFDVDVISTAMKKLNEDEEQSAIVTRPPDRFEAMKLIFQMSSDYHYFDMKNSYFWAGPAFWKRSKPVGSDCVKNKTKKKKEPREIIYSNSNSKEKEGKISKKRILLSKRTVKNWDSKKITLPQNHNYDKTMILDLFNMSINSDDNVNEDYSLESTKGETNKECFDNVIGSQGTNNSMESQNNLETSFYVGVYEDQQGFSENLEEKDPLNSAFYDEGLIRRAEAVRGPDHVPDSNKVNTVVISCMTGPQNTCEFTLVPAPNIVRIDPINITTRPVRIDMQHLKHTMLDVIRLGIEEDAREKETLKCNTTPEVRFENILRKLPGQLERRTADDLSPAMALMALLTLANENNLHLENNLEAGDVVVRLEDLTLIP